MALSIKPRGINKVLLSRFSPIPSAIPSNVMIGGALVAALEFSRQLHTGIVLTATGVSRCVEIEAYTVLTPLPMVSQVGVGVAFDMPVVAEACGLGSPGLDEEIEIRVYGRGLAFSTPSLPHLLEDVVTKAYADNGELSFPALIDSTTPITRIETIIASLEGSTIVVNGIPIPLHEVADLWGIIVRLDRPLNKEKIVEGILTNVGAYEDIVLNNIDNMLEALYAITNKLYEKTNLRPMRRIIREADRLGALSVFIDVSGQYVAFLFDNYDDAANASAALSRQGVVLEAPLTVLGI